MPRNPQGNSYSKNEQLPQKNDKSVNLGPKGIVGAPKEPLRCWECEETHLQRNFPHLNQSNKFVHRLQESSIVGEVGKSYHQINATLENRQEDYQSAIVEIEGTISKRNISILIDPGATLSYIAPKVMEDCWLAKVRHTQPWSVQLATGTRKKVIEFIVDCEVKIMDHEIMINLNFFLLW